MPRCWRCDGWHGDYDCPDLSAQPEPQRGLYHDCPLTREEANWRRMREAQDVLRKQNELERSWGKGTSHYHPGITMKEWHALSPDPNPEDWDDCKDYMTANPDPDTWPAWLRRDAK